MNVSRRNFLGSLTASVAAVLSFGGGAAAGSRVSRLLSAGAPVDGLAELGWSSFYEQLYTDFEFSNLLSGRRADRSARLRLSAMEDTDRFRRRKTLGDSQCFVLDFTQESALEPAQLTQGTYSVDHFALGIFDLFISEASVTDSGYAYTAVINRAVG